LSFLLLAKYSGYQIKKQLGGWGIWYLMGGVVHKGYWCGNVRDKDPPGRYKRTWEDNIKMIFKMCSEYELH
jgi:hypothetical protein